MSITYCECVFVALTIQHAMRMRSVILSPLDFPALQYISTLSHNGGDLKKKILNTKCEF